MNGAVSGEQHHDYRLGGSGHGAGCGDHGFVGGTAGNTVKLIASDAAGGIALNGVSTLNASTGTADLSAGTGGITQAAGSVITAGTLRSTGGSTGTVNLAGTGNAIGNLGAFAVTGADFTLVNSSALSGQWGHQREQRHDDGLASGGAGIRRPRAARWRSTAGHTVKLTASNAAGGLALNGAGALNARHGHGGPQCGHGRGEPGGR